MLVDHSVSLGIGWPEIAARLGVTRQAARQHYQCRHRDGASHQDQVACLIIGQHARAPALGVNRGQVRRAGAMRPRRSLAVAGPAAPP